MQIAKVLKSNGTDGGILMGFRDVDPEDISRTEPVFIEFDGLPVPFFIESFTRKGNDKAIVHLTGVNNLEDAEELVGKAVFAEDDTIAGYDEDDDEMTIAVFVGWTLLNNGAVVGEIVDYEEIPGNPCLYVQTADGQAMVPLHEDLILSVDPERGELDLDLPEGLV